MTVLKNYKQFDGLAWATGYLRNALAYQGVKAPHTGEPYSEAMLMGINGGLCAGYFAFEYEGHDPHIHFLTRYVFDENPGAVFERLGIPMNVQQTTNAEKGVANIVNALAKGKPVIAWVDMTRLGYNLYPTFDIYGLIMPLLVYGYDLQGARVYIADRACVPLTETTEAFVAARAHISKVRNKIMTIGAPDPNKLPSAVEAGIRACISIFVDEPPVGPKTSFGFDAYTKWANLLTNTRDKKSWAKQFAPGPRMYNGLKTAYQFLEVFFTGGRGARAIYADFLDEAAQVLGKPALKDVAGQFRAAADLWQAFTSALLPDRIAPLKETRDLLRREYELFLMQGNSSLEERQQIAARLKQIRADMEHNFPLSEAEAAAMRAELRDHIMRIHDAELEAINALSASLK